MAKMTQPISYIVEYYPDKHRGWSLKTWRYLWQRITQSRSLVWRLFIRDFSARYRQSVLGVLWAFILPILGVATFVIINSAGLLNVGETSVPYPLFALVGMTIWQLFSGGLTACSNAIVGSGSIVIKINFPKESLILAAMGQVIVAFLIRFILVILLILLYQVHVAWTVIFLPLVLLPVLMLTIAIGAFLALANVIVRDIANLVTIAMSFLIFLTPVVYTQPDKGLLATLTRFNPLTPLLQASRDVLFMGSFSDASGFVLTSLLSMILFMLSWRLFVIAETRLAERL